MNTPPLRARRGALRQRRGRPPPSFATARRARPQTIFHQPNFQLTSLPYKALCLARSKASNSSRISDLSARCLTTHLGAKVESLVGSPPVSAGVRRAVARLAEWRPLPANGRVARRPSAIGQRQCTVSINGMPAASTALVDGAQLAAVQRHALRRTHASKARWAAARTAGPQVSTRTRTQPIAPTPAPRSRSHAQHTAA